MEHDGYQELANAIVIRAQRTTAYYYDFTRNTRIMR